MVDEFEGLFSTCTPLCTSLFSLPLTFTDPCIAASDLNPLPPTTSLYAPLSLLLDPENENQEAGTLRRSEPTPEEPKGKVLPHPKALKTGKRVEGRAMIDEKFAEAVKAAAAAKGSGKEVESEMVVDEA